MIDTMSRAHDEDVAGCILRPHFDSAIEGKTVRNPVDQGKNLKYLADEGKIIKNPANEGKTIRNPANEGEIHFKFYLIKCSKIPPLLLIQSWILCSKF